MNSRTMDGQAAGMEPVAQTDATDGTGRRFFRRSDWIAFWAAFLLSLAGYVMTLAPTVTLEDSGELAVASDYLGVPHPPGYPIWTLTTWFFQWIFHAKDFLGHPNPAWGVGLASAFFGALACGLLAMLVSRSSADLLRGIRRFDEILGARTEQVFCAICGVSAGLVLAFSPVMWSQAVIVEVYALNAFFQILVMLLLYRWMARPADRVFLYAMAFLFGLGITNHQTLMLFALALALGILVRDPELFRDFLIVGAGLFVVLVANVVFAKLDRPTLAWTAPAGPTGPAFWVYIVLAVGIPLAGWAFLPNGKAVAITILLAELGLSFYLYLPFASDQNPPMNWAYPRTWEGFLHAISRGQYERITPTDVFSLKFVSQAGAFLADLRRQFTLPLVVGGILPFTMWEITIAGRRVRAFSIAFLLALAVGVLVSVEMGLALLGVATPAFVVALYRLVASFALLLGGIGVAGKAVQLIAYIFKQTSSRNLLTVILYILVLAGLAFTLLFYEFQLARMLAGSQGLGVGGALAVLLMMAAPPAIGVALYALQREPFRFGFEAHEGSCSWLLTTVLGFVAVGIVFIIMWNPALDVQTLFIGRVQFIQSHTLYALWLGYGLVLALAMVEILVGAVKALRWGAVAAVLVLPPGLMLWQNGFDKELVDIFGGAEQNGHDFGWQFGDWQLRGVNGVREYLEETLPPSEFEKAWAEYPDKTYPPEMASNAVFFGGTDPGRFVPTYMIYSAKVRSDVYLITQNALADNTYLNVMRDLYGDTIWIPSILDSNAAFQQYFDQVKAGQLNAGADIAVKDGRISVQGVQGVMQINGILARQIYDNNPRHEFYVEESYVIPWMYEFLEPHGLIMKISRQPSQITPELIAKDRGFWNWYCKRLLADSAFKRDVVARKTFSKLRGAIAGLYAARGHFDEAESAFRQAVDLYPLSPEANFRLADVYLARGRYEDARKIINDFLVGDPKNDKIREFLGFIDGVEGSAKRVTQLEQQVQGGRMEINAAVELVTLYRRLNRWPQFDRMMQDLLVQPSLPPPVYLQLGRLAYEAQRIPMLDAALVRYTTLQPNDPNGWIELGGVRLALGKPDDAMAALQNAVRAGGQPVRDQLRQDNRFAGLHPRPDFQQLVAPQAPQGPVQLPGTLKDLLR